MGDERIEQQERSHFGGYLLLVCITIHLVADAGGVGDIENALIDQVNHLGTAVSQVRPEFLVQKGGKQSPKGHEKMKPRMGCADRPGLGDEKGQQTDDRSDQEAEHYRPNSPSQYGN